MTLQIREMDITEKKNILEKKLEISEAETLTVISQLEIANRYSSISINKKRSYGVNDISSHSSYSHFAPAGVSRTCSSC